MKEKKFVQIRELLADKQYGMDLRPAGSSEGLENHICDPHIHKLGLSLTGIDVPIHPERIQILSRTENIYLKHLKSRHGVTEISKKLCDKGMKCLVVTRGQRLPKDFTKVFEKAKIPILRTKLTGDEFIERAGAFLEEKLAQSYSLHGVLVDVLGVGILLIGRGGIGKSECALELLQRGHRLVADDLVDLKRSGQTIIGQSSPLIKHHMEIRGLGIINIQDLFGIASVRDRKRVEMVIELVELKGGVQIDPLGLDEVNYELLGVNLPYVRLPVLPGKNLSTIIEVAARNHLLKLGGHHSAKVFQKKLIRRIATIGQVTPLLKEEVE